MTDQLRYRFKEQCINLDMDSESMYLLAVSGGIDSMVLMNLCKWLGLNVVVVHANFKLRGEESDQDATFVSNSATALGFSCIMREFNTLREAKERGISVQMAARELRYGWLGPMCRGFEAAGILTGHHLQDSVETFFMHYLRGAGLTGLCGIAPKSYLKEWDLLIYRPLLDFTRAEIEAFALENNIQWREDSSNSKTDYDRNRLRQELIPLLEAMKPAFWSISKNNLEQLRAAEQNYQYLIEKQLRSSRDAYGQLEIRLEQLRAMPHPAAALWEMLHPYGFTSEQVRQIVTLQDVPGKSFLAEAGARLVIDRGRLLLHPNPTIVPIATQVVLVEENDLMVRLPEGSQLIITDWEPGTGFPPESEGVVVDAAALRYPLRVRNWLPGDRFQPYGMEGKQKKIQDFLTDLKLNVFEKEQVKVLLNADLQVIWVLGLRLDHRFRVKSTSIEAKKISWLK